MSATTRALQISAVIVIFTILATILVGLRAVSRFAILKKALADDYLSIVALVFTWVITIMCLIGKQSSNLESQSLTDREQRCPPV